MRKYVIQFYSLIVKISLHKLRSPVLTSFDLLLPCLFVLALSVCYWQSSIVNIDKVDYSSTTIPNISTFSQEVLCLAQNSDVRVNLPRCELPPSMLSCWKLVGSGRDICYPFILLNRSIDIIFALYLIHGAQTIPSMDSYLIQSAIITEFEQGNGPVFLGLTVRDSYSHYGKLLVSSDNPSLAQEFMRFCNDKSGMCALVLHTTVFESLKSAQDYAVEHGGEVWAIVDLPSDTISTGISKAEFTISMNFTATPKTYTPDKRPAVNEQMGLRNTADMLYLASGFLTLQSFVQEFYIQRNVAKGIQSPYGVNYECNNGMDGTSCFINAYSINQIPMATSSFQFNKFIQTWVYSVPMVIAMSGIFLVAHLTATIVSEKSRGICESMLIMGIHPLCIMASWYASSVFTNIITAVIASLIMKNSFFQDVSYSVLVIIYFSYLHQNSAFCLVLSTFFLNPSLASWCGSLLMFLFATAGYAIPDGTPALTKSLLSLIPCTGASECLLSILNRIRVGDTFSFSDMQTSDLYVDKSIGFMWASSAFMIVLALYFNRVWPSTIGRREHPLFFLKFILRCFRKRHQNVLPQNTDAHSEPYYNETRTDNFNFDPSEENLEVVKQKYSLIENPSDVVDPYDPESVAAFVNLRKVYITGGLWSLIYHLFTGKYRPGDRCVALDGVSFALKRGEINILLGPNGAGKSTLMKLATGTIRPTSGDVFIKGHSFAYGDVRRRQHIGYCSQSDTLWFSLTVEEHLTFYARLKVDTLNVQCYVDKALEMVGLGEKRHCQSGTLSGGQRRRLCLAIALVADSEVLFLDEPTAGMDFETRNFVNDAIRRVRSNSSVLVTTHILEEADSLGDRILIINSGKLRGQGSPVFLKSCMKENYKMSCVLENGMSTSEKEKAISNIINFVHDNGYPLDSEFNEHVLEENPQSNKAFAIERHGCELCLNLPYNFLLTLGCELFEKLRTHKELLKLRHISLNPPTMKDVFLSIIGSEFHENSNPFIFQKESADTEKFQEEECYKYHHMNSFSTFRRHFRALLIKRLNFSRHDIKLLIIQIVLPLVSILIALFIDLLPNPSQPSILLDMTMYPKHATSRQVLFGFSSANTPNSFALSNSVGDSAFGDSYVGKFVDNPVANSNIIQVFSEILEGESKRESLDHMIAIAPNIVSQDGLRHSSASIMYNESYEHTVPQAINSLYNLETDRLFGGKVPKLVARNAPMPLAHLQAKMVSSFRMLVSSTFISLPFLLIPVYIVGYIVREKETGARHIQSLSGVNMPAFWLSSFCYDMASYTVTVAMTIVVLAIFQKRAYISSDMLGPTLSVILLYGLSSILTTYLFASLFKTPQIAQISLLLINLLSGFLWPSMEMILARSKPEVVRVLVYVMRAFPPASFSEGMNVISIQSLAATFRFDDTKPNMFSWTKILQEKYGMGGVGTDLAYMAGTTIATIIIFAIVEYTRVKRFRCQLSTCCGGEASGVDGIEQHEVDPLVAIEVERVCKGKTGPKEDYIVVRHLCKRFPGMRSNALNDLTFGVHKGEMMCLLGPNGTGKTTTLKILSGEEAPSCGSAYINGISIDERVSRSYIGYCPQYNPLLDNLSSEEHLWLYARLRNIREKYIKNEVNMLIDELGLYPHRHTAAHALSGGNQRRLSLAIAMVGRTTSVLLDEPTANMDIVGRLQTQSMLKRVVRQKSVILTTHLLDEVETLADRVVLLNHGNMVCVGSLKELKSRYAGNEEYDVYITFPKNINLLMEDVELPNLIQQYFYEFLACNNDVNHFVMGSQNILEVVDVQASALKLVIHSEPLQIIRFVAQLQNGSIKDVPAAKYVGILKKCIENIILTK